MTIKEATVLLGVASLIVVSTAGVAAQGPGRGGPANYSVAAETTVKGTVEELKPGPNQGMHVMLKTSDTTLELALGPSCTNREEVCDREGRPDRCDWCEEHGRGS